MEKSVNKIKIKTITCHDVYNFGASLQAFALMKYLQNLGYDVEIIDYKPEYMTFSLWSIGGRWRKNIFLKLLYYSYVVPRRLLLQPRRRKFDTFTRTYLKLTPNRFKSNEELKIDPPVADIYLVGSDQVWNSELPNGKDPAFFLDFAPHNAIKAAYAASFGTSQVSDGYIDFTKKQLSQFHKISVREQTGLSILESMGIKNASVVLDPVFLLDRNEWVEMSHFGPAVKYIFVYDQENSPLIRECAKRIASEKNLKIYAIKGLYPMPYADKKISDAGPGEFLGLIKNCQICLTNSFHCIAFSLIFQKDFFLVKRTHQEVNSRMVDLLSGLGLGQRIINNDAIKESNVPIDQYPSVIKKLEERKEFSKDYLNSVLQIANANN